MNSKPSPEWKTYAELEGEDCALAYSVHFNYRKQAFIQDCMFLPVTDGITMVGRSAGVYFIELVHSVPLPKQRTARLSMTTQVKRHSEIHSTLESMRQALM